MQESELADNEQGSCKFPMNETSSQASVVCSFSDGSSYQGPMVDDRCEGKGTFFPTAPSMSGISSPVNFTARAA